MPGEVRLIDELVAELSSRFVDGEGFRHQKDGSVRTDATAWAVLALEAAGVEQRKVGASRKYLALAQSKDGRVCLAPDHREVIWPTSLAVLAWQGAAQHRKSQDLALNFLARRDKVLTTRNRKDILAFDGTIKGWSWTTRTYSWVEPTALSLIAMRAAGYQDHPRVRGDAVRLLMDRQIPGGGWNVGCPVVLGNALNPMPENTGMALQALCKLVPKKDVEDSIEYLLSHTQQLNTPFTLGWSLLGLSAWGQRVDKKDELVLNAWERQGDPGLIDTTSISVLLLAQLCENGLIDFVDKNLQWDKE
jgi:hypothetical protein